MVLRVTVDAVPQPRSAAFIATAIAAGLTYVASNCLSAYWPIYQHEFGLSPLTVTTIYSTYVLTLIPTLIISGSLPHVIGFRATLVISFAIAAAATAVYASANGVLWLYLARGLQGLSVGLVTGAIAAALVALERKHDHRRASVASTMAISIGGGLGPMLGGVFASYLPLPMRLFFIVLSIGLVICAAGFLALPRTLGITGIRWEARPPKIPADFKVPFFSACAAAFLVWSVLAVFMALVPSFVQQATHTDSIIVPAIASGLALLTGGIAQAVFRGIESIRAQRVGLILVVIGLGMLVLGGLRGSAWLILVSAVVAGSAQGIAFLGSTQQVNALSSHRPDHAKIFAAFAVAAYCGSGIPIVGVGLVGNFVGTTNAVIGYCAIIAVAIGGWFIATRRLTQPPSRLTESPVVHEL